MSVYILCNLYYNIPNINKNYRKIMSDVKINLVKRADNRMELEDFTLKAKNIILTLVSI